MTLELRRLDSDSATDAAALLGLIDRCTPKDAYLRIDRGPDPFALGRFFGPTETWGAYRGEVLVGSAAASIQRRSLAGAFVDVPYLHDLRVDPAYRRQGVANAFGAFARAQCGPVGAIGTVLADNPLSAEIPEKTGLFAGGVTVIGATAHVVLQPTREVIAADEVSFSAWEAARRGACGDYAPAPSYWREAGGRPLLFEHNKKFTTALLTDEGSRRGFRIGGAPVKLGYLAFFLPSAPEPAALAALLSAAAAHYDLVAFGLDADVAKARGLPAALVSTTFAFGRPPARTERLEAHELLLI